MRKETRWLIISKKTADVLRGEIRWKHDHRHVLMTGKAETSSENPASSVVAIFRAIKRQMIMEAAIKAEELHFAGPLPDDPQCSKEHGVSTARGLTRSR